MSDKISKWTRTIEEWEGFIEVEFKYGANRWIKHIIESMANDYNVSSSELFSYVKDAVKHTLKKYGYDDIDDDEYLKYNCFAFKIRKKGKTAREIKSKIREITKDMEDLIKYMHLMAEDIAKRKDIKDWIWKTAVMTERGFRPE